MTTLNDATMMDAISGYGIFGVSNLLKPLICRVPHFSLLLVVLFAGCWGTLGDAGSADRSCLSLSLNALCGR